MITLNYIFVTFAASLGLIMGAIVSWMAEEELKDGTKIFILVKKLLFITLMVLFFHFKFQSIIITSIALIIAVFITIIDLNIFVYYLLFAYFLFRSEPIPELFLVMSIIIFIFGFPVAALFLKGKSRIKYHQKEKTSMKLKDLVRYCPHIYFPGFLFVVLAILLQLF